MGIRLQAVTSDTISNYISVGIKSYDQHYLHLWKNGDSSAYIDKSFTVSVVEKELSNPNCANYLIRMEDDTIGIVKLIKDAPLDEYSPKEALLAEKIYLLKEFSGKGFGRRVLTEIERKAKALDKKIIWLDTMQKGGPINFYLKQGFNIKKEGALNLSNAIASEKAMWVLFKNL